VGRRAGLLLILFALALNGAALLGVRAAGGDGGGPESSGGSTAPGDEEPLGRLLREFQRFETALEHLSTAEGEDSSAAAAMVIGQEKRIDRAARRYGLSDGTADRALIPRTRQSRQPAA
jgi:hypothetical protein